ncbi:hypothetical protein PaG_04770 [Moesziomyces aphidis]|uniref:Uncharacterized protein n=1 Tax=Moesziomyces aphidis TaxID=84754 RepID=W3VGS5_MOEAP|nr:hypothetical protein PaG_04770 [Moesziomyces aphidis]
MNASIGADQSGLSDLSAASDLSMAEYFADDSPLLTDQQEHRTTQPSSAVLSPPSSSRLAPTTPVPRVSRSSPGPVGLTPAKLGGESSAAWTPSPDASSSRSATRLSVARKASPRMAKDANESMGSSLGTFDYSNASFSESFLRQAGAHMLAGLDEATQRSSPSPSSSSPRYRTSSSPTVTARPLRPDPRTPFTGKSLRTRMAEAGMLDSPASSDGSSPSCSPTVRTGYNGTQVQLGEEDIQDAQPSPDASLSPTRSPASSHQPGPALHSPSIASRLHQANDYSTELAAHGDWQEGLSMVPEESYIQDTSSIPASPANQSDSAKLQHDSSAQDVVEQENSANASTHSLPYSDASKAVELPPLPGQVTPSPNRAVLNPLGESSSPAQSKAASPSPLPQSKPPTPQSAPRSTNTPKSFMRLRMVTPARSSPLSRVVNFSPASSSSSRQWQSPSSHASTEGATANVTSPRDWPHGGTSRILPSSPLAGAPRRMDSPSISFSSARNAPQTPSSTEKAASQDRSLATPAERSFIESPAKESYASPYPETPQGGLDVIKAASTPSHMWSPATSASFATPASQRPQQATATPHVSSPAEKLAIHASLTPEAAFGTPKWSPSPAPAAAQPRDGIKDAVASPQATSESPQIDEHDSRSLSSSCSSSSGRKQSGCTDSSREVEPAADTSSDAAKAHPDVSTKREREVSLWSPQHSDSPSAARFSRMQLARLPTKPVAELGVAELAGVASAFDSLAELSDSRVARLLAQLQASTAYIDSLETALDAKERDEAHLRATWDAKDADLDEVRAALTQLSAQYAELVADAEAKDARMQGLVDQLQGKVERAGGQRDAELERQLEEERRLREVERRDFEVRMRAIRSAPTTCGAHDSPAPTADGGVGAERASEIEQAKAELRATLEKDFALEEQLASRSLSGAAADERLTAGNEVELQREVESLTAELDRRFEELCDVRAELGDVAAQRDAAEDHAAQLEEDLAESAASSELATLREQLAGKNAEFAQLDAELATLRLELADKDAKLVRLGEELLSARAAVRDAQPPPQPEPQQEETTRGSERVVVLERQLANAELELVRLRKAHDALAQDNVHWSIALAAKQLELGMVKRNARFALKQPKPNLLPESLKASRKPQKSQETDKADKVKKVDKVEKVLEVAEPAFPSVPTSQPAAPNRAREHARQLLAQRRALLAA